MFKGTLVALVTPFSGGRVDYAAIERLVDWHVEQGTDGLVPVGTTGESPTVTVAEHEKIIETVVRRADGRIPVVAGTGGNATAEAVELTRFAQEVGADASLQVCPYYNKPTQEGLYRHFAGVAEACDLPQVLYNIPSRTGVSMTPETVARLAGLDQVVAIKEATGSMDQASQILSLCDLTVLSGDDSLTLPLMALGGQGVISVVANLVPKDVKALTDAMLAGDVARAQAAHRKLFPLCRAMFVETNPIPVKTAMKWVGLLESDEKRLPLTDLSPAAADALRQAMTDYGLL
ncbi:MAG: 4-hydroxy-tetrahydrodipicolinate synthase [Planctomycetes bacterium SM23_25]|nr:MAG: 4-hydroxy-tetrahydrodipicolinate synthase [Planctomycetes bacterium SM23_25]